MTAKDSGGGMVPRESLGRLLYQPDSNHGATPGPETPPPEQLTIDEELPAEQSWDAWIRSLSVDQDGAREDHP